jgi:hypothetical protein
MLAREVELLNRSEPLPFQLDENVSEEVRLKYRYLDLRREAMSGACGSATASPARCATGSTTTASSISKRRC